MPSHSSRKLFQITRDLGRFVLLPDQETGVVVVASGAAVALGRTIPRGAIVTVNPGASATFDFRDRSNRRIGILVLPGPDVWQIATRYNGDMVLEVTSNDTTRAWIEDPSSFTEPGRDGDGDC